MKTKSFFIWNPLIQSPEQNLQWAWLRAMEWGNWPAFLSISVFPIAIMFFALWKVLVVILVLTILWSFIRYKYVNITLSDLGFYFVSLRWVIIPLAVIYFIFNHNYFLAVLSVAYFPLSAFFSFFVGGTKIGVIQKMLIVKLELKKQSYGIINLVSKILLYSDELTKALIKDFPLCNDYQEDSEEYKNKYRDIKFQFLLFFEQVVHCFAVNKIKNKNKILRLRSLVNNFIAENFQDANKDNLFNGNSYGERSFWYSFESIPKYSDCLEILSCKLSIENGVINTLSTNIAKLYKNENKQPANYDYYINIISEKLKDEDMGALIDIVKKKI